MERIESLRESATNSGVEEEEFYEVTSVGLQRHGGMGGSPGRSGNGSEYLTTRGSIKDLESPNTKGCQVL